MAYSFVRSFVTRHAFAFSFCGYLVLCVAVLAACSDGGSDSNSPTGPSTNTDQPVSMTLTVTSTPSTGDVREGQTRQYAIQVRNSAGTILPAFTAATWSVSGGTVATISQTGLATCNRAPPGTAAVTVTATGPTGSSYASLSAMASLQCIP